MSLLQAIRTDPVTLAAVESGDWSFAAACLRSLRVTAPYRKCSSSETVACLIQAGFNPTTILTLLENDANGRFLLSMLTSQGIAWDHPLTVTYIQQVLPINVVTALRNLSAPVTAPWGTVTDSEIETVWKAEELQTNRNALQTRFNAILNKVGTSEQPQAVLDLRAMVTELES